MKLLRVEGVNLAHSIDDTEDLSTRRGGSLLLLKAIDEIAQKHPAALKPISTGASAGLFEVTGDSASTLESVKALLATSPYCYATFVVDLLESSLPFQQAEVAVLAANRWQQMSRLSFSATGLTASATGVCGVDEIRPASEGATVKGRKTTLSASVFARRQHGLDEKRNFYQRNLDSHYADLQFAADFEDIASAPPAGMIPQSLDGKIAIFYADGNTFGDIARACTTPDALLTWDVYIRGQRKQLLSALLERACSETHWQTDKQVLRLETLLWGGDELMFVVPAWCGLELATLFFERTTDMRYPDNPAGQLLTHACGLVFCHQQAPISRIAKLAKALAEQGKMANRQANSLNWLVLESFDHTGAGLDDYLLRRFGTTGSKQPAVSWPDLALNPDSLHALAQYFLPLKNELPHSAVVHIARAMAEGRAFSANGEEHPLVKRAHQQVCDAGAEQFLALWKRLHPHAIDWQEVAHPDDLAAWIKLAELWDYCPIGKNAQQGADV